MNGLKPIKMPSAKEKVAAELRKAILSRQMKEGEILSLDSVASQLNVSAMPVREAFQILARDGLIQLRKNKAAVVLGVTETYIKEHYQVRAFLEIAAVSMSICTICAFGANECSFPVIRSLNLVPIENSRSQSLTAILQAYAPCIPRFPM